MLLSNIALLFHFLSFTYVRSLVLSEVSHEEFHFKISKKSCEMGVASNQGLSRAL